MSTSAELDHIVRPEDLATSWSNNLPVLATPVLLWLGELAAMKALEPLLGEGEMSVGVSHASTHLAPTGLGELVHVHATLQEQYGRMWVFSVNANDRTGIILRGTHTRAVVDGKSFAMRIQNMVPEQNPS